MAAVPAVRRGERVPSLAVTLLEDIALVDSGEAEGRKETHALVHLGEGH